MAGIFNLHTTSLHIYVSINRVHYINGLQNEISIYLHQTKINLKQIKADTIGSRKSCPLQRGVRYKACPLKRSYTVMISVHIIDFTCYGIEYSKDCQKTFIVHHLGLICPIYLKKIIFVMETIDYYISTKTHDQRSNETFRFILY